MSARPDAPLVLHIDGFWISPYAFSAFVALREKGLPFEVREVALDRGEQRGASFQERSLTGRVPVLEHGDFVLAESSAIVEYLDEVFAGQGARLLPEAVRERARARQVMAWIRSDLLALRDERATHTMFFARATAALSDAGQAAAARLVAVAERLVPADATPLFGAWSIADADLGFMLHRLILNGHEVPARLGRYAAAQWARPSAREFVEHARPATYVAY